MRVCACILILISGGLAADAQPSVRDIVASHNAVRAKVGVGPLVWSDKLAAVAQAWADGLIARGEFAHSSHADYGENLYEIRGAEASPEDVVKSWAEEARDYDYARNICRGVCGHYTQIVWRSTNTVGCAVARRAGREVWVCEYGPPGNWVGEKPY